MRFFVPFNFVAMFAFLTIILALPDDGRPNPAIARADEDLTQWFEAAVVSIFPNHTGWDSSYAQHFDKTLVASFGLLKYNYSSLMGLYGGINQLIAADGYNVLTVEFTSITVVPNTNDAGGFAVTTGLLSGYKNGTLAASATDGLFATISVVDGKRKFTEWHEISNFHL
ncbi:hypothetical protein C8R43DRAFT_1194384 [Mycena crocata]|nr:hypothetical protein C8R43DRAFT_1194384 [Mycena crocata]